MDKRALRIGTTVWAALLGTLLVLPSARAADLSPELRKKLAEAKEFEKNGEWAKAWELYHQIRKAEHNPPEEVTKGYQSCLRRIQQARRFGERASAIPDLTHAEALDLYVKVLKDIQEKYVDRKKVSLSDLFQNGVEEMSFALLDETFLKDHLRADAKPEVLQALRAQLDELRVRRPAIKNHDGARKELQSVMLQAGALGIKPSAVLVEFVCGACNALDEYTGYLSPRQLAEVDGDLSGKSVGVGIDLGIRKDKDGKEPKELVVLKVIEGTSAYGVLFEGDVIVGIDGQAPDLSAPAAIDAKMQGDAGTSVVLEVERGMGSMVTRHKVKLERRPIVVRSVEFAPLLTPDGIGYVKLSSFQKTTLQEMKSALLQLRSGGLKALVLDLRGNLGGYFPAALQVAELFLSEGVIAYTQRDLKEEAWRASNPDALAVPMVVLVDGDTASAAEVLAGALKENKRATLIGQTTYGKGSIQCLVRYDKIKSGLQVTVARFLSPDRLPYDGRGVTPHQFVDNTPKMMGSMTDVPYDEALALAKRLANDMPAPMPKMPPPS